MSIEFYQNLQPKFIDTVKRNATSSDVVNFIVSEVNKHAQTPFAKMVVQKLSYGNPTRDEFIKRVFDYVCHTVDYLRDPSGKEIIFTPKLLINRARGDCKKQTKLIATILKAAGIEPTLKVISYGGKDWEHIFVTAKNSNGQKIILDPVNDKKFNQEIRHRHGQEFYLNGKKSNIMNDLISMGNKNTSNELTSALHNSTGEILGHCHNAISPNFALRKFDAMHGNVDDYFSHISGDEYIGKKKHKLKDLVKKLVKKGKNVGFAPMRAAFLGLLLLGKALEHTPLKLHLSQKLALLYDKDAAQINKFWSDFGGDPNVLKKTILKGMKAGGVHGENISGDGIGIVTATTAAAAITTAMPVVIAAVSLLKKSGLLHKHEAEAADNAVADSADAHDENGEHGNHAGNNEIIKAGASQGDKGHDASGDGSDAAPHKGFCFLTTACVGFYGMPDDCYELTTLRKFRDQHLEKNEVAQYYAIAPTIVEHLEKDPNKKTTMQFLRAKIGAACMAIELKQFDKAKTIYTNAVQQLARKYKLQK
jgi:hypothetical protein